MPRVIKGRAAMAMMAPAAMPAEPPSAPMERTEKVSLAARIVYAAAPADAKPAPVPAPPPPDLKH
jgi:hypothetical protein